MAYDKTTWVDRSVENASTYSVTTNEDSTITLTEAPGTVYQAGTPLSANNMNHIENGIANVDTRVTTVEGIVNPAVPVANGGTGATTAADARTNLGAAATVHTHTASQITDAIPVSGGGTGATTVATALSNLNVYRGPYGAEVQSSYPAANGIFRMGGGFSNLPSGASEYGTLIIFGVGYTVHLFINTHNQSFIGITADSLSEPNWYQITTTAV